MQPRCRQVPPTLSFSTRATFRPTDGAVQGRRIAARATSDHREIELLSRRDHLLDRPRGRLPIEHANRGSRAGVIQRAVRAPTTLAAPRDRTRRPAATPAGRRWVGRRSSTSAPRRPGGPARRRRRVRPDWSSGRSTRPRPLITPQLRPGAPAASGPATICTSSTSTPSPARRDPVTPTTRPPTSAVAPSGRNDATRSSSDPRPASTSQTPPATRIARPHARARAIRRRVLTSAACYGPPAI